MWEDRNRASLRDGVLTTGGGQVLTGTPEGFRKTFASKNGEELWSFQTGSGAVGASITREQDGEPMVSVVSGRGGAVPPWGGEVAKSVTDLIQGGMVRTFRIPHRVAAR